MGLPVIATDVPGCREVVDQETTGILIPSKYAVALAQAMLKLANKPVERRKMGRAGREKIVREFDEKIVFSKTLESYVA